MALDGSLSDRLPYRIRNLGDVLMAAQAVQRNLFVYPPEAITEKPVPSKPSSGVPLFRQEDLGEHPPLDLLLHRH